MKSFFITGTRLKYSIRIRVPWKQIRLWALTPFQRLCHALLWRHRRSQCLRWHWKQPLYLPMRENGLVFRRYDSQFRPGCHCQWPWKSSIFAEIVWHWRSMFSLWIAKMRSDYGSVWVFSSICPKCFNDSQGWIEMFLLWPAIEESKTGKATELYVQFRRRRRQCKYKE